MKQESQDRCRSTTSPARSVTFLDAEAEACRADHRAVPARQAPVGHVVPAGVLEVCVKQFLDAARLHPPAHGRGGAVHDPIGRHDVGSLRLRMRHLRHDLRAAVGPDLHEEPVLAVLKQFGQRDVEARGRLRPCVHRHAKTGPAGLPAVDRHDERALPAGRVDRIDLIAAREHAVLDHDCVQLAGAHADEREPLGRLAVRGACHLAVIPPPPPQQARRGKQLPLPRLRADVVAKQRAVVSPPQPVDAAVLLVRPPGRQVGGGGDVVVGDGSVPNSRPDQPEPSSDENIEQFVQAAASHHEPMSSAGD